MVTEQSASVDSSLSRHAALADDDRVTRTPVLRMPRRVAITAQRLPDSPASTQLLNVAGSDPPSKEEHQ
jgi:hypothetical protein